MSLGFLEQMLTGGLKRENDWAEYLKRAQHLAEQSTQQGNKDWEGGKVDSGPLPLLQSQAEVKQL